LLHRDEQRLLSPCVKLLLVRFGVGGVEEGCGWGIHASIVL
jgi:hypothetical protein